METNPLKPEMTSHDVLEFLALTQAHNIEIWIDGGWSVDALLERQTRVHSDLDIALSHKDVPKLRVLLEPRGYKDVPRDDTRDCNFVLGDDLGHQIDFHSFTFDVNGEIIFGVPYPRESLTGTGSINGIQVKCISPEWSVKFHTGYEVDIDDYRDVLALCGHFGLEMPLEFEKFRLES
jgi:lincosamide nucleotidyltransferase A/C/D/E